MVKVTLCVTIREAEPEVTNKPSVFTKHEEEDKEEEEEDDEEVKEEVEVKENEEEDEGQRRRQTRKCNVKLFWYLNMCVQRSWSRTKGFSRVAFFSEHVTNITGDISQI